MSARPYGWSHGEALKQAAAAEGFTSAVEMVAAQTEAAAATRTAGEKIIASKVGGRCTLDVATQLERKRPAFRVVPLNDTESVFYSTLLTTQ